MRILEDRERPLARRALLGAPPLDRRPTSVEVVVRMTIPGFQSDDRKIAVTGDVLSTRDEIGPEKEKEGAR